MTCEKAYRPTDSRDAFASLNLRCVSYNFVLAAEVAFIRVRNRFLT